MKLVTAAQMRTLEQRAVAAGTSIDALMEAAGLAVAQEAWLSLGVVSGRRICVLCGPGHNGGDGLVAARHLAEWEGDVVVYLLARRGDDDANLGRVREVGVPVRVAADDAGYAFLDNALAEADLIIDALLGTGRSRPIAGALADVLQRVAATAGRTPAPKIVAVDLPTGVDADSGRADPLALRAGMTVTFGHAKVGLYMPPGSDLAGDVQVVEIGLPRDAAGEVTVELMDTPWVRARLPERPRAGNKGTFGRILVVAGSRQYVGAARLSATACYRAGAGLVTVACPASVQPMVAAGLAEATYLPLPEEDGAIAGAAATAILEQAALCDVLLIGPGLGQSDGVRNLVVDVLASAKPRRGCVIDADALNALAKTPDWASRAVAPLVLTPHPGEMARLRGSSVEAVQGDRLGVALAAAAEWRQTVVLKGAHTVVAAPDGRAAISPCANPLLATAGTGDVLAGVIAGLLAQGAPPFDAAACGVYIHAQAAEEISEELGDRGMLAGDLLPQIPRTLRMIREGKLARSLPPLPGLAGLAGMDLPT